VVNGLRWCGKRSDSGEVDSDDGGDAELRRRGDLVSDGQSKLIMVEESDTSPNLALVSCGPTVSTNGPRAMRQSHFSLAGSMSTSLR